MDTKILQKFAPLARAALIKSVAEGLENLMKPDSRERRSLPQMIDEVERAVALEGKENFVERMAYTWFNRLCAFRFLDLGGYGSVKNVVTPLAGYSRPGILTEAARGADLRGLIPSLSSSTARQIAGLLSGEIPSERAQEDAYGLLLLGACDELHRAMPQLFGALDSYSNLLLPEGLLAEGSLLWQLRKALTPENCADAETLGWLYQYYISEKKDAVFAAQRKGKKVAPEEIPAATQLFTPLWIVRYLVENSLGRLWMLNHPQSRLIDIMDYYIAPREPERDFLKIDRPQELTFCDPACGSGHMLVYAFDLLARIYEEQGYAPVEIPELILKHNLTGLEIDERAAQIAGFALILKACQRSRRYLKKASQPEGALPRIVAYDAGPTGAELRDYAAHNSLAPELLSALERMSQAATLGTLLRLQPCPLKERIEELKASPLGEDILFHQVQRKIIQCLESALPLTERYAVVATNPPYMGNSGMCSELSGFLKENYSDSKGDLCTAFIERCLELTAPRGCCAMVTMQSWMFLSSFENLRLKILKDHTLISMAHAGTRAFDSIGGEVVSTTAFVVGEAPCEGYRGSYLRLVDTLGEEAKKAELMEQKGHPYRASAEDFAAIPGSPVAYWVSDRVRAIFREEPPLGDVADAVQGLCTSDDDRFLKYWYEVPLSHIGFDMANREEAQKSGKRWFPCNKGGAFRKWWGNQEYVVNWENDGSEIRNFRDEKGKLRSRPQNMDYYFRESVSWSKITSSVASFRSFSQGFIHNDVGHSAFGSDHIFKMSLTSYLNNCFVQYALRIINATMTLHIGYVNLLPYARKHWNAATARIAEDCIALAREDWNGYETSWDFQSLPLLNPAFRGGTLAQTYENLRAHWAEMTARMKSLEEENNRLFIDAYGLAGEMTPDVPLKEITLTCNPAYRYAQKKKKASGEEEESARPDSEVSGLAEDEPQAPACGDAGASAEAATAEQEKRLRSDTARELISYALGCAFGRYSLSAPGLILAGQSSPLEDYWKAVGPETPFPPLEQNAVPLLDQEWFAFEGAALVCRFLTVVFGAERAGENLRWLEDSLDCKGGLQGYMQKQFYKDHLQRCKKRPIYWLFSSSGGSFKALVYLHRYSRSTAGEVLALLRQFKSKVESRLAAAEGASDLRSSEKRELERLRNKVLPELQEYELRLFALAADPLALNLDDGVRRNYLKLGGLLEKIPGLE